MINTHYAFFCGGCICNHCANNVEVQDKCTREMKEACFRCDSCKHFDGTGIDRQIVKCNKYSVTNEYAKRLRSNIKIIKGKKARANT